MPPLAKNAVDSNIAGQKELQKSIMDSLIDFIEQQSEYISEFGNYSLKEINSDLYYTNLRGMSRSGNRPRTLDHINSCVPGWFQPELDSPAPEAFLQAGKMQTTVQCQQHSARPGSVL